MILAPLLVGSPRSKAIKTLLKEMDQFFLKEGCDLSHISSLEICTLPKCPQPTVAIPDKRLWQGMARTLKSIWEPLRAVMNCPLNVRGYRTYDYNQAVGGDSGSRHLHFQALDIYPADGAQETANRLIIEAKKLYIKIGDKIKLGVGFYSRNVHVDTGFRRRHWGPSFDRYNDFVMLQLREEKK